MERLTYKDSTLPRTSDGGETIEAYSDYDVREIINRLATYEDLEEQGRLVVLPCKPDVTCTHAQGEIYINAIGEACLYCDIWDGQRNISLGECIGNCDCAEAEKALEVNRE